VSVILANLEGQGLKKVFPSVTGTWPLHFQERNLNIFHMDLNRSTFLVTALEFLIINYNEHTLKRELSSQVAIITFCDIRFKYNGRKLKFLI